MKLKRLALLLVPAALTFVGCSDYDNGYTQNAIEYENDFLKTFGKVDPNQDWSMATSVQANVNLPEITGTSKMNIMTGDPRHPSTRLLGQITLNDGKGNLKFDAIKGQDNVFVSVIQDGKYKIFGHYEVVDGLLNVGEFERPSLMTRAFDGACPTETDGNVYEIGLSYMPLTAPEDPGSKRDAQKVIYITSGDQPSWGAKTIDEWIKIAEDTMDRYGSSKNNFKYNDGGQPFLQSIICTYDEGGNITGLDFSKIERTNIEILKTQLKSGSTVELKAPGGGGGSSAPAESHVKIQYLKNIEKQAAQPWIRGEGYALYGEGGFFEEYLKYYNSPKINTYGSSADDQIAMIKKIEADFEIITTEDGPVSVPFIYGATSNQNQLGYIICDPEEDPLTQTHYVLINDARPNANVYQDSWKGNDENNKLNGFSGTSIFDSFIKPLKIGDWSSYNHKDDPITCYCSTGSGIWSKAYGTGETDGVDREGTGIYSHEMKHGSCKIPMQEYLNAYNTPVYGTEYRLSYWDNEKKEFTYTVPAGKKVVFFLLTQATANGKVASTYNDNNFTYSQPSLNKRVHKLYYNTDSPTFETGNNVEGHEKARGAVGSVAWQVGETIYMGFGDGGNDEDLNDLIFVVKGGFTTNELVKFSPIKWHMNLNGTHDTNDQDIFHMENNKVGDSYSQPSNPSREGYKFLGWATSPTGSPIDGSKDNSVISGNTPEGGICYFAIWEPLNSDTPDPDPISWLVACEDLGGVYDYDFNDLVFALRKTFNADGTTAKLELIPLAAGGTYKATVKYDETVIGEIHALLGETKTTAPFQPINVVKGTSPQAGTIRLLANNINKDISITDILSHIKIEVEQSNTVTTNTYDVIYNNRKGDSYGNTPQMILLPEGWDWPAESVTITRVYESFATWVQNSQNSNWTVKSGSDYVNNPLK